MRSLHALPHPIANEYSLLFYGSDTRPCADEFHRGYESERYLADAHSSCAQRVFRRMFPNLQITDVWLCNCELCTPMDGHSESTHYYFTHVSSAQRPAARNTYLCWSCRNDVHPAPEERPQ